jgi:hypothetical protein
MSALAVSPLDITIPSGWLIESEGDAKKEPKTLKETGEFISYWEIDIFSVLKMKLPVVVYLCGPYRVSESELV